MTLESTGGAYWIRAGDGRRTRLYQSPAGAERAAERGEWFTDKEYEVISAPKHDKPPIRRRP